MKNIFKSMLASVVLVLISTMLFLSLGFDPEQNRSLFMLIAVVCGVLPALKYGNEE